MLAGRTLRDMGTKERAKRPGLASRGNRALVAVVITFITQFFAGLLGAEFGARWVVGALAGVVAYVLLTGYAGKDSSR